MKYKVGEEVRVVNAPPGVNRRGYVGKIHEVTRVDNRAMIYKLSNGLWYAEDDLEEVVDHDVLMQKVLERNNKPKPYTPMTIEEHNEAHLGETYDPVKPSHYRKGEIDLYESWYRTYPFNEFRAGMQMIAERYMKRDKDNRIQDLNKAIYTLERLRGYEENEK